MLYFLPMIAVLLMLYYFIKSEDWTVPNGVVLIMGVGAFVPVFNTWILLASVMIWAIECKWFNEPFKGQ